MLSDAADENTNKTERRDLLDGDKFITTTPSNHGTTKKRG
jgi:hypothetical protein